ncbi:MAG: phosphoribosylanthranilate isomerase, partial [Clostridiales Family XIII bacterium]|nr:phosphoribosylanthranilate isomerase [Clostridiales Family XIII bacterium]
MKIKICGIFRVEDAAAVNTALPDFAGFVFVPESRRRVTPEAAAALRKKIDARVMTVGVFRNAPPPFVSALVRAGTIGAVQLHGDEDAPYTSALRAEPGMDGAPIIKAISVTGAATHGDGPFGSRQAATQKDRPHGLLS